MRKNSGSYRVKIQKWILKILRPSWLISFGGDVIYIVKNGYAPFLGLRITSQISRRSGISTGDSDPVRLRRVVIGLRIVGKSPDETVTGILDPLGLGFPCS